MFTRNYDEICYSDKDGIRACRYDIIVLNLWETRETMTITYDATTSGFDFAKEYCCYTELTVTRRILGKTLQCANVLFSIECDEYALRGHGNQR